MFEASTYQSRRRALMDQMDGGLLLFLGHGESPKNFAANTYAFRQDSAFLYFTGLQKPGLALLLDVDEGRELLFGPETSLEDVIWMGPQPGLGELAASAGIPHAAPVEALFNNLREAAAAGRSIHFLPPYRGETILQLGQLLGRPPQVAALNASEPLIRAVVALVSHKSEEEVAQLEEAVNTTGHMHVSAIRKARTGMSEAELAGLVEGMAVAEGGGLAYAVILTVHGEVLHNHHHHNILQPGQLVLGDFGAETPMGYAGDITRSFPVSPTFSERQKDIYQLVLDAQLAALEALKPGVLYRDVHLLASRVIAQGLIDLGLMKGRAEEAVEVGAHALFFPHGLGHLIGLDVHEMESLGEDHVGYTPELPRSSQFGLKSLRLARALEPGFALTVEPGIYFIPPLIEQWQAEGKFRDFIRYAALEPYLDFGGIRIEDDVLVTAEGYRLLGNPIPKTVADIEQLRAEGPHHGGS